MADRERLLRILEADTVRAARVLLGWSIVRIDRDAAGQDRGGPGRRIRRARIVETEAYLRDDPAAHSFIGETPRTRSMFGPPGRAYVFRIHQVFCLNVICRRPGVGEAVLIRAVEPLEGVEEMRRARARRTVGRSTPLDAGLTSGPGRLCQAFDIDLELDGVDLMAGVGASSLAAGRVAPGSSSTESATRGSAVPDPTAHGRSSSSVPGSSVPGSSVQGSSVPSSSVSESSSLDPYAVFLEPPRDARALRIARSPRIGISKAKDALLRFTVVGSPWLSRP